MAIIFRGVEIKRDWEGRLKGDLHIQGDFGRATLNLTEELCAKILHVCADNIVEAAELTASEFRREALQLSPAIIAEVQDVKRELPEAGAT